MKIAIVTVLTNAIGSLVLFRFVGFIGIAIATSLAGWVNVVLLVAGLRGSIGLGRERRMQLVRILLAAVAMGGVVFAAYHGLAPWFEGAEWQRFAAMLLLVGVGAAAYGVLALALRATSVAELKAGFRR